MLPEERTEWIYRIALTMVPALGPVTARKLIRQLGSARAVFDQKKEILERIRGIGPRLSGSIQTPALLEKAETELAFLQKYQISVLSFQEPEFPSRLNECADGPVLLYSRGTQGLNCRRSLSVVGTRRATSYGKEICRRIIRGLSEQVDDLVIISGLAYGIDVIAHRAAMEYGLPTVAVLGHGFSTIYPNAHRDTARRIMDQGALLTDFHSKMGPERNNFLRRNRIIAGLADATLVVESAQSGGALITADLASSYNREVLAVPGRVGDPRSEGCNGMIKNHRAALVESAGDIMNALNWTASGHSTAMAPGPGIFPSEVEKRILLHIREAPGIGPGSLSNLTGIPVHRILAILVELELKQWVRVEPGNSYHCMIMFNDIQTK